MSNKRGKYLFIGALLGFLAGIFLAPKKGSDLRKDAKEKIDEVKDNPKDVLQETIINVKDKISDMIDDSREEDNIRISEEEIIISKSFDNEGEIR